MRQRAKEKGLEVNFKNYGLDAVTRGCLGGIGFCFVSHVGKVQPCGYLEVDSGSVREKSFKDIWWSSPIFLSLRDFSKYKGKCGRCEYIKVCGGCRARAHEYHGDFMQEEPLCTHIPRAMR
jgi:radical SAM protein with 4Fe4S-binding SPASM domain